MGRSAVGEGGKCRRQAASIGGAALGGVLVAAAGPGWGLAIDAATFALAGALRYGMQFPSMPPVQASSMLAGLREGWHEFISRRWLWVIVAQFSIIIAILSATISVLGPLIAHSRLGGATSWGYIAAAYGTGAALGALAMIRYRPQRMLLSAALTVPALSLLLLALAVPLPVPLDITAAFLAGGCLEVFSVNWATTLQQEIPPERLSRVASYDALGPSSWPRPAPPPRASSPARSAPGPS